jgi:hypothetical protein
VDESFSEGLVVFKEFEEPPVFVESLLLEDVWVGLVYELELGHSQLQQHLYESQDNISFISLFKARKWGDDGYQNSYPMMYPFLFCGGMIGLLAGSISVQNILPLKSRNAKSLAISSGVRSSARLRNWSDSPID